MSVDLQKLLRFAAENSASDLHLQTDAVPMLRIAGQMRPVDSAPLSEQEVLEFIISIAPHDDRDCLGRVLRNTGHGGPIGNDDLNVQMDQLGCDFGESILFSLRKPPLNDDVLTFNVAEIAEPLAKCLDARVGPGRASQ